MYPSNIEKARDLYGSDWETLTPTEQRRVLQRIDVFRPARPIEPTEPGQEIHCRYCGQSLYYVWVSSPDGDACVDCFYENNLSLWRGPLEQRELWP